MVVVGPLTLIFDDDPTVVSIAAPLVCAAWYAAYMPYVLARFAERPPKRVERRGMGFCALAFAELRSELRDLLQYPEAVKYLVMCCVLGNNCLGVLITLVAPYALTGLGLFPFSVVLIAVAVRATHGAPLPVHSAHGAPLTIAALRGAQVAVLLIGTGLSLGFRYIVERRLLTFKQMWVIIYVDALLITTLTPLLTHKDHPHDQNLFILVALAGVLGALGLLWYYAIGWAAASHARRTPPSAFGAHCTASSAFRSQCTAPGAFGAQCTTEIAALCVLQVDRLPRAHPAGPRGAVRRPLHVLDERLLLGRADGVRRRGRGHQQPPVRLRHRLDLGGARLAAPLHDRLREGQARGPQGEGRREQPG